MAAPAPLPQPSVTVEEVLSPPVPTFTKPVLYPCIVGACYEVMNVVNDDGTTNSAAKVGSYDQVGGEVPVLSWPTNHNNIDQLSMVTTSIQAWLLEAGNLVRLPIDPGSSFLMSYNLSSSAAMQSAAFSSGLALGGLNLILSIDNPVRTNVSPDIVVTFTGGTISAVAAAAQINAAVGQNIATAPTGATGVVLLQSQKVGVLSSLTVRIGGSANPIIALGYASSASAEERVEGAGFRGQYQSNNLTQTPWIEWYRGGYILNGATPTTGVSSRMGWIGAVAGSTFSASQAAAVTFGSSGTIPIQVGDYITADGVRVGGLIQRVEQTRIKMGTIDTSLSTYDDNGNLLTTVYDLLYVGTILDPSPFAPGFVWFQANNLTTTNSPVAAAVTGTIEGVPATTALLTGTVAISTSTALAGETLQYALTVNGVTTDGTYTITGGPFANMAAIAAALSISGLSFTAVNNKLVVQTVLTGASQSISLTGGTALSTIFGAAATATGTDISFPAILKTSGQANTTGSALMGTHLDISYTTNLNASSPTWSSLWASYVITTANSSALSVLVAELNGVAAFVAAGLVAAVDGTELIIYSTNQTANYGLEIASTSTAFGTNKLQYTSLQGGGALNGQTLSFSLDSNPHVYTVSFISNSIVEAISDINAAVGATVASTTDTGGSLGTAFMKLTSILAGIGSSVAVTAATSTTGFGQVIMGLSTTVAVGSGRPLPDAYLDGSNNLYLGSEIVRDSHTGNPLDQATNPVALYIQYKGLRLDVSALATQASVLTFSDPTTLKAALGPLTSENPLGLAALMCMSAAPQTEIKVLGIDDVTAASPDGTQAAWSRAAALLEAEEVYSMAPLSQDDAVHGIWISHIIAMNATGTNERILLISKAIPTETAPQIASSGVEADSTQTANQLALDSSPTPGLAALGINTSLPLTYAQGVFCSIVVAGELRNYLISSTSGNIVNFTTTFSATQNTDGFYTTTPLTESVIDAAYTIEVRGTALVLPGTDIIDTANLAITIAEIGSGIANRKVFDVFPDQVEFPVNGTTQLLPTYYACAIIAGMRAINSPAQGFTNMAVPGLTGLNVNGPSGRLFTKSQLDQIAGGGVFILQQDVTGGVVFIRQQVSTDLSSIETQEMSVTCVIDAVSKSERAALRLFIGTQDITPDLIDACSIGISGILQYIQDQLKWIESFKINAVYQNTTPGQTDRLAVDETIQPAIPCNGINIILRA
jgi:hypothetical protein